ncbi:MAG: hypothetical protein ACRC50_00210, partial [Gaiella sp.]
MRDESDTGPTDPQGGARPASTLAVKLAPPRIPSWYVSRPALETRLDGAVGHRLALVTAGAGYGKTTHLASRARVHGWAWYTADRADESETGLARGLVGAISRVGGLEDTVLLGAGPRGAATAESLAAGIVSGLDAVAAAELVLVVDDVHEIGASTGGAALLESLVRYAPPRLHLVFGTRHEPPFAVARLRGSGGLLEVHARDLAFSAADVETVVETRLGGESRDLAPRLLEATGGWPVAVYLATEALRSADVDARRRIVDSLVGHSDALFAFLAEEVIGREPPSVVTLLGRLAELERAPAALIDAVGEDGDALLLSALARRGLVAESPGETREYSLHALVREFLLAAADAPAAQREVLHRRAAVWYADHDRPADGLREAITCGEPQLTASLLARFSHLANWGGLTDLVIESAATIPDPLRIAAAPADVSHSYIIRGDFARAREWMAVWAAEPETLSPAARAALGIQRALLAIGEGSAREALNALERYGEDWSSLVSSFTAYQLLDLGRIDEAQAMAARGMALAVDESKAVWTSPDNNLAEAHQVAGEIELERERPALAAKHFDEALRHARRARNLLAECATISRQ